MLTAVRVLHAARAGIMGETATAGGGSDCSCSRAWSRGDLESGERRTERKRMGQCLKLCSEFKAVAEVEGCEGMTERKRVNQRNGLSRAGGFSRTGMTCEICE